MNGLAIASLVLGILWLGGLGAILAVIFGHIALRQIRRRAQSGRGLAIAGLTLGYVGIAGIVLLVALGVVLSSAGSNARLKFNTVASSIGSPATATAPPSSQSEDSFPFGSGACPHADGSSPRTIDFISAPQKCTDPTKAYTATFDTTAGPLVFRLDNTTTPGTTNNFVVLALYHYYDDTQLFRIAKSIGIIQGGSPHDNTSSDKGPGYSLADEGFDYATLNQPAGGVTGGPYTYAPGDLVMARAARPNGASAQFFFAVDDKTALLNSQGVYVKFGSITQGLNVLQRILASAATDEGAPDPSVTITKVTITER